MAVRLLILGFLAWQTLLQEAAFRDNISLWQNAVESNETDPRPAYNLAVSLRINDEWEKAVWWFVEAGRRSEGREGGDLMRRKVAAQLQYLEMFGHPVCDSFSVRPYCS